MEEEDPVQDKNGGKEKKNKKKQRARKFASGETHRLSIPTNLCPKSQHRYKYKVL